MVSEKLESIIEDTLNLCAEQFSHRNIAIKVGTIPAVLISCRSAQISQVVINILNNAKDAIEEYAEKWISIEFVEETNKVEIRISDCGLGISPEAASKIFQPFFTTKDVGKGTGLGLSISKGIIEDHKGRIFVDHAVNHTCFVIELPKVQEAAETAA